MIWTLVRLLLAVSAAVVLYVAGAAVLRKFKITPDAEPDPADLHPVDLRFRCTVCGAEVTMTTASGDAPEAPRHCRENMVPA